MKNKTIKEILKQAVTAGVLTTMAFVASPDKANATHGVKLTTPIIGKDSFFNRDLKEYIIYSQNIREYIDYVSTYHTPEVQELMKHAKELNMSHDELKMEMYNSAINMYNLIKAREKSRRNQDRGNAFLNF